MILTPSVLKNFCLSVPYSPTASPGAWGHLQILPWSRPHPLPSRCCLESCFKPMGPYLPPSPNTLVWNLLKALILSLLSNHDPPLDSIAPCFPLLCCNKSSRDTHTPLRAHPKALPAPPGKDSKLQMAQRTSCATAPPSGKCSQGFHERPPSALGLLLPDSLPCCPLSYNALPMRPPT